MVLDVGTCTHSEADNETDDQVSRKAKDHCPVRKEASKFAQVAMH